MQLGDYVFNYAPGRIGAVSRVAHTWVDFQRPVGYPRPHDDDVDDGWLVRVQPVRTDLNISYQRAAELITLGAPGPLGRNGVPSQKYMSERSREDGLSLLAEAVSNRTTTTASSSGIQRQPGTARALTLRP